MKKRKGPGPSGTRRGARQPERAAESSLPRSVSVATYHIHDLAAVEKVVAALHPRPRRKRPDPGGRGGGGSGKGKRAGDGEHGPLYLADDDHLILAAPPGRLATTVRKGIERELGDAIEHVQTQVIKIPEAVRAAWPSRPRVKAPPPPARNTGRKRA